MRAWFPGLGDRTTFRRQAANLWRIQQLLHERRVAELGADAAYDLLEVIQGLLIGDKGYIRPQFKADCEALGIDRQTPVRKNMAGSRPRWFLRFLQWVRKRVETVISQLEQRFAPAAVRARDPWHLTNRVARKILAHTLAVSFNLRLGREPLQFDELVIA